MVAGLLIVATAITLAIVVDRWNKQTVKQSQDEYNRESSRLKSEVFELTDYQEPWTYSRAKLIDWLESTEPDQVASIMRRCFELFMVVHKFHSRYKLEFAVSAPNPLDWLFWLGLSDLYER